MLPARTLGCRMILICAHFASFDIIMLYILCVWLIIIYILEVQMSCHICTLIYLMHVCNLVVFGGGKADRWDEKKQTCFFRDSRDAREWQATELQETKPSIDKSLWRQLTKLPPVIIYLGKRVDTGYFTCSFAGFSALSHGVWDNPELTLFIDCVLSRFLGFELSIFTVTLLVAFIFRWAAEKQRLMAFAYSLHWIY